MSLPYFPLFPTDFEADTSHLTLEEDGAFNRLLRLMWMTPGCSLPDDDRWIMRRMRVDQPTYDRVVSVVIDEFMTRKGGRIFSSRLAKEWQKTDLAHRKRVEAGKKGGLAKGAKTKEKPPSKAKAKPKQPEPEPYTTVTDVTAPVDFTKEVFDRGIAFLSKYGTPDQRARALIGKWRKEAGDSETFNALRDANREGVTEPVAWITARLKPSAQPDIDALFKEEAARHESTH